MIELSFDLDREAFKDQCARLLPNGLPEGGGATGGPTSPHVPGAAPRSAPSSYLRENGFSERLRAHVPGR